ncbi:conserved hypothetical protein [Cupriavidus taiwanensis]|uniref:Uncharacterized protein n=1 Tax=Cupriavidus taiwanensis TaxID=164546 RepID=A0A375HMF3_9BURK|nr:conserved hypothetical protein [Cupriavidus taiwanensis]SOY94812.1 conserved hypothetical protein [Cupriavidus taiwanensis]SOZ71725.1 conserved hypothetical protein [Cupriavidus taiwanensis]SOZ86963.1 conserved hypothetical protein [Cupriavidus taiwanensis]SOZ90021.1 conserved hypothetical protein [Cupriavidus taiwanensis]
MRRGACTAKAHRRARPRRHHFLSESSDIEFGASRLSGLTLQTYRCITASVIPRLHTRKQLATRPPRSAPAWASSSLTLTARGDPCFDPRLFSSASRWPRPQC